MTEGTDDWEALIEENSKVEESFMLRLVLYHLLTKKTTMGEEERCEAVEDAALSWSVNEPNIRDSHRGDRRTVSDIFDEFESLASGEKTMRMTLLFVNF